MIGIYFSGTGNTKYCIEKFLSDYDNTVSSLSIEDPAVIDQISKHQDIILAYPIYYSNLPKILRDFISDHFTIWKGKRIFIISTMGLFSGDGTGVAARLLQSYGAQIIGGLHIKMPDCICDEKALKRSYEKNKQLIEHANKKIKAAAKRLHENNPTKEGLGFLYHMAGLFGQRLWFYNKTKHYTDNVKIDDSACIRCGICTKSCPMNNLSLVQNKVVTHHQCTMCYRCANLCPQKAITILGSKVVMQNPINDLT